MCDTQSDEINDLNTSVVEALNEIRRLTEKVNRLAEMLRIKDDLINKQVQRIMYLEGVRG